MAYQGNAPAYRATPTTKDTFSGDGSTTSFTLSKATSATNARVVVANVIQDPNVAYTVTGTTLTFTSAPPSGTDNIYVVHLGPAQAIIGNALADLTNVSSATPADGNALVYDNATALWKPGTVGGGGTIDVTASDAITAGDCVGLNADGTASTVGQLVYPAGVFHAIDSTTYGNAVCSDGNGTFLFVYAGGGAESYYAKAIAGTYSGGTWTFGTAVTLDSNGASNYFYPKMCWDSSANAFVITYGNNSSERYVVACTVSGTTVTCGTRVQLTSGSGYNTNNDCGSIVFDPNNGKSVVSYIVYATFARAAVRTVSVSGTTITLGTEYSAAEGVLSGYEKSAVAYDSTNQQFLLVFNSSTNSQHKYYQFTVSGTTVTWGGSATSYGESIGSYMPLQVAYSSAADAFLVIASQGSAGGIYCGVITISGTTPTVYDKTNQTNIFGHYYGASNKSFVSLIGDGNDFWIVNSHFSNTSSGLYLAKVSITDTNGISIQGKLRLPFNEADPASSVDVINYSSTVYICYDAASNSVITGTHGYAKYSTYTNASVLFAHSFECDVYNRSVNFIGIASENIADTATGSITVTGGVNESVSGLTTGNRYYLSLKTGDLSDEVTLLSKGQVNNGAAYPTDVYFELAHMKEYSPVGVALSPTKFLITDTLR